MTLLSLAVVNSCVQSLYIPRIVMAGFFHSLRMTIYKNPDSGVNAFEFGPDYIITLFGNQYYLYSDEVTGMENVKRMKQLAITGKGLSSFISRNIRKKYEAMFENETELRIYLKRR